jgi:LytS/YehU family sensor histidine kinase
MKKRDMEIEQLKVGMSFQFVKGVQQQLEKDQDTPQNIAKSITSLSKVLRFKLYRKQDDNIILNYEIEIIERYLSLLSIYDHSNWKIKIKEN